MIPRFGRYVSMTLSPRRVLLTVTALTTLVMAGCAGNDASPSPPTSPTPAVTASAYILPDAVKLGDGAFGDEAVVIYRGERLRWVNADVLPHVIVADSPDATDFRNTDELLPRGEQSFIMNRVGTTRIHCATHPNMTGTLVVREH